MANHTPSTAEVKETYGDVWDDYRDLRNAEFDRWLETVKAEARSEALPRTQE